MHKAVIGQRNDLQNYNGPDESLNDWIRGVQGHNNWSWRANHDFIMNHVQNGNEFTLITPVWDLDAQANDLTRNNTLGIEILALIHAGYQLQLNGNGGRLVPPATPDIEAMMAILNDPSIPNNMRQFWARYRAELIDILGWED